MRVSISPIARSDLLHTLILFCLLGFLATSPAFAQDADPPTLSIGGFGTAGVVHSSESRADFTSIPTKGSGAGFSHDWSADVDSVIGVQATANFTPQWSAVLQIVSEQNYDRTYRPHAEWANVKYQVNHDFSLRLGRTALPLFLAADSRKTGYVNPWVRPPPELYSLITFTSNDGLDASYRMRFGDTTQTLQVTTGRSTSRFATPPPIAHTSVQVTSLHTVVDTLEHGPLTLRLSYVHARLTIPELAPLFDGFEQFGPDGQVIAQKYRVQRSPLTVVGLSASYDPGDWFVMAEFARVYLPALFGTTTGEYVTAGYRIGRFTPYATAARTHAKGVTADAGLSTDGLPPFVVPAVGALNGGLNTSLARKSAQTTYTIGGRWDFAKSASLKLQFDHILLGPNSAGTLSNLQPGFVPGGRVNVFSAAVDFVF